MYPSLGLFCAPADRQKRAANNNEQNCLEYFIMFSFLFIDISRANLYIYFVSEKKRGIIFPSPYEAE